MAIAEYSLEGKTALITGAGRGIGTGIAEVLAEAGASVIVNALTEKYLVPFAEKLAKSSGRKIVPIAGDCASAEGAANLAAAATKHGEIDILVNCLGDAIRTRFVAGRDGAEAASDALIEKTINLNLMATVYVTRAIAPAMVARGKGKIINISSVGGVQGSPGLSLYSASKWGVAGLTRSLALEWATRGVNVNAIAPGLYPDPSMQTEEQFKAAEARIAERVPMHRAGRFRDVGLLALYLASPASDYMTGQVLSIDGGMTA